MVSKYQKDILGKLAKGEVIKLIRSRETHMFWSGHINKWKSPRVDSVISLVKKGYVESYNDDWRGADYRITQAGQDYIDKDGVT